MSHLAQWSALVGTVLPLLVAIVQQSRWSRRTQTIVGVASSAVAAFITAWTTGNLDWHDYFTSLVYVFTLTKVTYAHVWKPTGVAPKIEEATNINNSEVS